MRKIIIAFDGTQYSEGAMAFAKKLNDAERISLTGLFLPLVSMSSLWSYADPMTGASFIPLAEEGSAELVDKNITRFNEFCSAHNIRHEANKALFDFAMPELRKETRFADIVILGSETFYHNMDSDTPSEYLKDALHFAECPVVVVPESYAFPEKNILAYDGSESSVFAIKQFMYLFPEFAENPTLLVTTNNALSGLAGQDSDIHNLVSAHFNNISFLNLQIDAKKYFSTWMSENKKSVLVCGAFSRSMISQILRQSFVEDVLRDHKIPVFISHR
jgi:nucleotide-binding universal stress UspA family protein